METSRKLEAKLNEFGLVAKSIKLDQPPYGKGLVFKSEDQRDRDWKDRLTVLQFQLKKYFNISLTPLDIETDDGKTVTMSVVNIIGCSSPKFIDSDNPLLCPINSNWRGLIPFDKIKLEHFLPAIKEAIEVARVYHELIATCPDAPSFNNTLGHGFDYLDLSPLPNLSYIQSIFGIYENLCTSQETHEVAKQIDEEVSKYRNSIMFDRRNYDRVLQVNDAKFLNPLTDVEARLLDDALFAGRNKGYDLSAEKQEELKKLKTELSRLYLEYSNNMSQATNKVIMTLENVPGLPERALDNMKREENGKVVYDITVQAAIFSDILEYCTDRELRKKVYIARAVRSFGDEFDNKENCIKIANITLKIANLLGYKTVADKILAHGRMISTPQDVLKFLGSLAAPVKDAARINQLDLNNFITSIEGKDFNPEPWDYVYYSRLLSQERFNLDPEKVREYFSYKKILQGAFWLAKVLYNLDYQKVDAPVYEEGVEVFEIMRGNQYMGMLYIDPFMRSNKQPGAYCDNLVSQGICDISFNCKMDMRPITLIMTNFERSGKLCFNDVQTLLHEFGHSLQETLSEVEYASQSGNNVYWDYVELASQFMENFAYEPEFLEKFATNDEGNVIPKEYIDSLKAQANFLSGLYYIRQLEFCYLDLAWFCKEDCIPEENLDIVGEIEKMALIDIPDGRGGKIKQLRIPEKKYYEAECHSTAFSHIFSGGYTAGYYSYLNAEVLAADAFDAFGKDPIHNKEMADKFRRYILSVGDTEDPMELYKKFRGSEPGVEALLKQRGLL